MTWHKPSIEVLGSPADAAIHAARIVLERIREGRVRVLGLATGGTMVPFYASLVATAHAARLSFRSLSSFNLDEYAGLASAHASSFHAYMERNLFAHADFDPARIHLPDGNATDLNTEAIRYERAIAASGGIDLQVLGIGRNGHIGFNEPGSSFASRTRVVALSPQTRIDNAADFAGEPVPERALTMGIATILEARELVLLATGSHKADALAAAFKDRASAACPASALQDHPRVRVVCDEAAAACLNDCRRTA